MNLNVTNANGDGLSWFVVHTHAKQEDRTSSNLNVGGIETLSPRLRKNKANEFTGKLTQTARPLFPGYIFARFRFDKQYHTVRYTRGVHSVVCFNNAATPVDDEIIDLMRSRIGPDGFVKAFEELTPGDEVIINDGRFQHLCGVFEREMEDTERVSILLNTVSFQAHVVVERALVKRVLPEKRPASQPNFAYRA